MEMEMIFTNKELKEQEVKRIKTERTKLYSFCKELENIEDKKSSILNFLDKNNVVEISATLRDIVNICPELERTVVELSAEMGVDNPMSAEYSAETTLKEGDNVVFTCTVEKTNFCTGKKEIFSSSKEGTVLEVSTTRHACFVCWYEKEGCSTFYSSGWKRLEELQKK